MGEFCAFVAVAAPHETTPAAHETLAQSVARKLAAHGFTIEGLPNDATEEQVVGILEAVLLKLDEERAA